MLGAAGSEQSDEEFTQLLEADSNFVASQFNKHREGHDPTCFKYSKTSPPKCRFLFPRQTRAESRRTVLFIYGAITLG